MSQPFSQACENNKQPILAVLREVFADRKHVLEIGSGTGQHAVFFAKHLPYLQWQTSDVAENLPGIASWRESEALANVAKEIEFDVCESTWPAGDIDAVFTANTMHIMAWPVVEQSFQLLGRNTVSGCKLCVYGPFNYNGEYTSASNARFDQWLAAKGQGSAIRNFEDVDALASAAGFALHDDVSMPANNRLLVWQKTAVQT